MKFQKLPRCIGEVSSVRKVSIHGFKRRIIIMKLNKAQKFIKRLFEEGYSRIEVRGAIFDKFNTSNFPPEYEEALVEFDPTNTRMYPPTDSERFVDIDAADCCQEADLHTMKTDLIHDIAASMPEPGTKAWESMVDFMRADLDNNMGYSKLIKAARESMESRGLNFDEEFSKWKRDIMRCNSCKNTWRKKDNSTGYCEKCGSADVAVTARLSQESTFV
jgi:hypothetical protein